MEQFNKALSFVLGLIVVAVFIVVASGKFNIKGISLPKANITTNITPKPTSKPWFSFFGQPQAKATPTPIIKPTSIPKITVYSNGLAQQQNQGDPNYHPYTGSNTPTSIPNTGIPVILFPLFGTSLITGIFMKKTGKKD